MYPNDEESAALKESILLPFVLTIFDRDKAAIERSGVKFPRAYIALIEAAEKRAHADLMAVKRLLNKSGLKVYEEKRDAVGLTVRYRYRGYRHEGTYILEHLKAETEIRVKKYLGGSAGD